MIEPEQEIELRMDWPQICKIACASMIRGLTIDEFSNLALRDKLDKIKKQQDAKALADMLRMPRSLRRQLQRGMK